jgi:universal stress protein E
LIIKDVHHEPTMNRAMFSELDIHLLRDSHCPLHLVNHASHALPRRILVAVDVYRPEGQGGVHNDELILRATNLAQQCGADL